MPLSFNLKAKDAATEQQLIDAVVDRYAFLSTPQKPLNREEILEEAVMAFLQDTAADVVKEREAAKVSAVVAKAKNEFKLSKS